jgi:hypothetical protein
MLPPASTTAVSEPTADATCPICGSTERLQSGSCVSCLINIGLQNEEEIAPE